MSKTILADVDGFTPVIDVLADKEGLVTAAVFGRMWRFCQMSDGVCRASLDKISVGLGIDRATVQRHADKLCELGYIKDTTPELRNKPHIYIDTGKAGIRVSITVAQSNVTVATEEKTVAESQLKKVLKKESKEIPLSIENSIFTNQPIDDNEHARQKNEQEACLMFEKAFGFGRLPWNSQNTWVQFSKFITNAYNESQTAFGEYVIWRADDKGGKYTGFSNKKIRENPQAFMDTGWPEFISTRHNKIEYDDIHDPDKHNKRVLAEVMASIGVEHD